MTLNYSSCALIYCYVNYFSVGLSVFFNSKIKPQPSRWIILFVFMYPIWLKSCILELIAHLISGFSRIKLFLGVVTQIGETYLRHQSISPSFLFYNGRVHFSSCPLFCQSQYMDPFFLDPTTFHSLIATVIFLVNFKQTRECI